MTVPTRQEPTRTGEPGEEALPRLGYLLKLAQLRFSERVGPALAPLGINNREWAALISLDDERPSSQAEVSKRSGIDRTTMVALIDELERTGLVRRRPDPADRRKNVIELTAAGRDTRDAAARLIDDCERRFLAPLGGRDAEHLKRTLHRLSAD